VEHRAHFRIFGVPVRVEPLFVIVAVVFGIRIEPVWVIFAWVLIVFVSVLVHEMGHAFAYRLVGQRSAVVLHGFGGFTVATGGGRRVLNRPMSVMVSLAGVTAQLLLLALPAHLLLQSDWGINQELDWFFRGQFLEKWHFNWWPVLYYLKLVNIWWAIFNLLPIRPLDGGHVAEEVVGFVNACRLSIVAAAVAGIYLIAEWSLWAGLFMAFFAFFNYRDLKAGHNTGTFDVEAPEGDGGRRPRRPSSRRGGGRRRRHLEAVPSARDLGAELSVRRDPADLETGVWNALRAGDSDRAAALLKQGGGSTNGFLQASVALAQGHDGLAGDMFEAAYLAQPDGPPNLVPAALLADRAQAVPLAHILVSSGPVGVEAASSLQTHLHYAERFQAAAEVGEQVFAAGPRSPAQTGFEVACSWARAGRPDEGLRWVEAAIDAGFRAPGLLDSEPDLAPVRGLPGWTAVRTRLRN
jgi:stage IV sporulation protein FB